MDDLQVVLDPVVNFLEEHLFFAQGTQDLFFIFLALADVGVRSGHAHCLSLLVPQGLTAGENPDELPILFTHAEFDAVGNSLL